MSLNSLAIKMIKKYQQNKKIIGTGRCKHYPTCSNYAIGCYEKFNFIKASFLTLFRIIRCNPLTKKCYDPVPLNKKEKKEQKIRIAKFNQFTPYLKYIYHLQPKMEINDYINFIYEGTFGVTNVVRTYEESTLYTLEISESFERVYNDTSSTNITNETFSDELIEEFNYKLYLLKKLIKKKEIPLNYKETFHYIEHYLASGIKYLEVSNSYKENYSTNYTIRKRK